MTCKIIIDVIKQNANPFIPTKPAQQKRKTNPWMTPNILLLLRKRYRLFKRWRRYHKLEHLQLKTKYAIWFSEKSRLPKIAPPKSHHQTTVLSNRNFWNIVNQYWQPSTHSSFLLLSNGIALQSDYDKSNIFNNLFASVSTLPNVDLSLPLSLLKQMHASLQYTSDR